MKTKVTREMVMDLLQALAESGDDEAQECLGRRYYWGKWIPQSYPEAVKWMQMAADKGNADACLFLGELYANGEEGVEKDTARAAEMFIEAANNGDADLQFRIAVYFDHGIGVEEDPVKAAQCFTKAAEAGLADAQSTLADMYAEGRGVGQDLVRAADLYEKAALQGEKDAARKLAECYQYGRGREKDFSKAVRWYRKAAELGDEESKQCLRDLPEVDAEDDR